MANLGENGSISSGRDLYGVLGLRKECSTSDLRNAYKRLALRWHPDRCSASGNSKYVEEANSKFQAIQQAYSVLSDANKRFLYDVGAYHSDDDDDEDVIIPGMGDFLNEMADMMSQTEPTVETGEESFEQLQDLFNEMFNVDIESSFGASSSLDASSSLSSSSTSSAASYTSYFQRSNSTHGSSSPELKVGNNGMKDSLNQASHFQNFSLGVSYHSCLQCHEFNPAL
ncbi:unnamed protein product [Linum tenue]|uniref:J domain-containing protein n=1 Tax=Linum tenue TaxID=586396 RepID=A0AAV0KBJ0_9ROSI|nr:unnamed protein product [Linum tenue]